MMLVEETAPELAALPIAQLRAYLRLGSGFELATSPDEDAALAGFVRAAIAAIEARTDKVLLTRSFLLRLTAWREDEGQPLPLAPVSDIHEVVLELADGQQKPIDPAHWQLKADMHRPALLPKSAYLPPVPSGAAVRIRFQAGFGASWEQVPADLAQAVLMLAAHYYEDRGQPNSASALPFGVSALIERWRLVRILGGGRGTRAGMR